MSKRKRESTEDVETYWRIRQHRQEDGVPWKKLLRQLSSDHSRKCVRALLKHSAIAEALDPLLGVPGLRDGWSLSTVHKMVSMRCDNVRAAAFSSAPDANAQQLVVMYLRLIWESWRRLIPGNGIYKLDSGTVKAVETRCPRYSNVDKEDIYAQIQQGIIFAAFSVQEREQIWSSLLSIDHLMPSLFTLLRDLHFLQACTDSIRYLVKFPPEHLDAGMSEEYTIDGALRRAFRVDQQNDQYLIETASGIYQRAHIPTEQRFDLARRQLWLYAMRNFKDLPQPRQNCGRNLLAKAELEHADEPVLYHFAILAERLGFSSPEIEHLKTRQSPRKDPKPNRHATTAKKPVRRCGLPNEDSYERDAPLLFIQNMHREFSDGEITSFFVRRSVYLSFFGPCQFDFTTFTGEVLGTPNETAMVLRDETAMVGRGDSAEGTGEPSRKRKKPDQEHGDAMQADAASSHLVTIVFKAFRDGSLYTERQVTVDPANTTQLEELAEIARGYTQENLAIFSMDLNPILASEVYQTAVSSGLNAVLLLQAGNIDVNNALKQAIAKF
jgi:hypothetical protein